ncbi:MAG: polysaccharide deacetylase family protein [Arcobacter butzleri]|jgi:peptidoglycan/xylan/chitin deacetylase (PgdA/CDA1 family)|nr:polysaccharide deacetylase family protein [Arcobacteraceae bacterium]MDY0365273.1 polysaccharide deacetylase family protein [Arcobacteraceae bacterium]NLO17306.1 polysaccharide deacetylase family protein [Aliarcobacter butzleri]
MRKILFLWFLFYAYSIADATIFVYHRFGDDRYPSTNTSLEQIRKDFEYLKNNDYRVVPLSLLVSYIQEGKDIPPKWVVLTIDDNYKSFYENGLELFKEFEFPFTLFVYVEASEGKYGDFMTWEMIQDASHYGEIELHSYAHPWLTKLSEDEIVTDTQKAFEIFEKRMGYKPKHYAYPYGAYNKKVQEQLKSFGIEAILNQTAGATNKNSSPYDLFRVPLTGKANISGGLKYEALDVEWLEPLDYPKDGILKKVKAKVDKDIKKVKIFVTEKGWIEDIPVHDGIVELELNTPLTQKRSRIAIGTTYHKISSQILIK